MLSSNLISNNITATVCAIQLLLSECLVRGMIIVERVKAEDGAMLVKKQPVKKKFD